MPTISSRPPEIEEYGSEPPYSVDEIAGIIKDAVLYVMPNNIVELRACLHVVCRTLWNTGDIEDFFIYDASRGGCDVGFRLQDDPHYHVITVK